MDSKDLCRNELRASIRQLRDRCLYSAAKWASEQLVGIEQDPAKFTPSHTRFQRGSSSIRCRFRTNEALSTPSDGVSYVSTPVPEDGNDDVVESDFYLLAKSYFDCKEYRRAAHVLRDQTGQKAVFLRCYALYLAGERRKEEEIIELGGALRYPWNWNAWLELQSLCSTLDVLNSLNLGNHWMKDFFLAYAYHELRMPQESLEKYEHLRKMFCFSNYIQAQIAKVRYILREFDQVEVIFEELLRSDPHRVEDMDMYSNVLYSKESCAALSFLAHRVSLNDKYRPESCCIIGNYYSLKGQHEKSIVYFRRALKLNRNYLSAWTLMGHEYVEVKNTPAAIDAYRRALDMSPCDYRAWYGLGQAYEMTVMPLYALYYFKRSVQLQPNDARLWIAMAQCYECDQLQMLEEAIKCYKRAADCEDTEAIAINKLAKLHKELGRSAEAAFYYKKDLERMDAEEREGPNMVAALSFLAKYCRSQKRYEEAEMYCTLLLDFSGPEKETAKNLL